MDNVTAFAIIILAALIHASFQLSVSVLTLLSGHAIGSEKSHRKLVELSSSFVFGVGVMTMLLLATTSLFLLNLLPSNALTAAWTVTYGLLTGVGLGVWLFYYHRKKSTSLWIPRQMAQYLTDRTKATQNGVEAFGLGLTSVVGELVFIIAPIAASALVLIQLSPVLQILGVLTYTLVSLISLLIVATLIGGGHKISRIQKWRESNKYFIQFVAGSGLIILAGFIYVFEVVATSAGSL